MLRFSKRFKAKIIHLRVVNHISNLDQGCNSPKLTSLITLTLLFKCKVMHLLALMVIRSRFIKRTMTQSLITPRLLSLSIMRTLLPALILDLQADLVNLPSFTSQALLNLRMMLLKRDQNFHLVVVSTEELPVLLQAPPMEQPVFRRSIPMKMTRLTMDKDT